ncbi:MAG: DUF1190 domain-containing protein [Caulobacter sp.]|nr:DUF1190 domain-containing protein [Caulobacter sp.]
MKRSKSLTLTGLMAGASLSVAACDSSPQVDPQAAAANKDPVEAYAYATLEQCKAADQVSDEACEASYQTALKDDEARAPRYETQATCEDVYGAGQCVPRSSVGHQGSFFTPLLAGFVIGRMMDGGSPYYRGTGVYRRSDRYGGGYYTGFGGAVRHDYASGRTTVGRQGVDPPPAVRQAPARVQTRSAVVSRGGFGGRGRSYGG